jgi:hypothetical protein
MYRVREFRLFLSAHIRNSAVEHAAQVLERVMEEGWITSRRGRS